jgi:hypothetical protein
LAAPREGQADLHAQGYKRLLQGLRDDRFADLAAGTRDVLTHRTLPIWQEA